MERKENEKSLNFIAMEYWGLILNRTFLIFVNHERVLGLKVRGVIGSFPNYLLKKYKDPNTFITKQSRKKYNDFKEFSDDSVVNLNWHNFILKNGDIQEITHTTDKKMSMGMVPHSGRIFITDKQGKKREFILLGIQDTVTVREKIKSLIDCLK